MVIGFPADQLLYTGTKRRNTVDGTYVSGVQLNGSLRRRVPDPERDPGISGPMQRRAGGDPTPTIVLQSISKAKKRKRGESQ